DARRAGPIVGRFEVAAEPRLLAQHAERIRGDVQPGGAVRRASFVANHHRRGGVRGNAFERSADRARLLELAIRQRLIALSSVAGAERDDAIHALDREAADADRIDQDELGVVDADAKPEHGDRQHREARILQQQPYRKAQVAHHARLDTETRRSAEASRYTWLS